MVPRISGSSILEIHTGWLELAFHRLGIGCGFSSLLSNKHPPSSNPASITLTLPRIPPESRCRDAIASYFATIHVLYPILDPAAIDEARKDVLVLGPAGMIEADRLPELLLLYLVLVLGSAETDHLVDSSDLATSYIGFCETMLGHALGWGTFDTVRITFLLALALRRADKITSAWPITGLCVSVAQMLGLHRKRSSGRRSPEAMSDEADQARRRAWWSIYAFENLFAFEIGRPSAIQDLEHDQLEPDVSASDGAHRYPRYFEVVVGLARTLSQVNKRSIQARAREERAGGEGLQSAIRFKVATTGEVILLLMKWAESLPEGLRPRSDLLCGPDEFPLAAFVSIQYHSAYVFEALCCLVVY